MKSAKIRRGKKNFTLLERSDLQYEVVVYAATFHPPSLVGFLADLPYLEPCH